MYGIPLDLDLRDIVGSEISQIRIGRYDVQFHFNSGRGIYLQGDAEILNDGIVIARWTESTGWSTLAFQQLLNATISGYSVINEKLLEIRFEIGLSLYLHDSFDQYESMQVHPEGFII